MSFSVNLADNTPNTATYRTVNRDKTIGELRAIRPNNRSTRSYDVHYIPGVNPTTIYINGKTPTYIGGEKIDRFGGASIFYTHNELNGELLPFNDSLPSDDEMDGEPLTRHFWCFELMPNQKLGTYLGLCNDGANHAVIYPKQQILQACLEAEITQLSWVGHCILKISTKLGLLQGQKAPFTNQLAEPTSTIASASFVATSEKECDPQTIKNSNGAFTKIYSHCTSFITALEAMNMDELNSLMESLILYEQICDEDELVILQKTFEIVESHITQRHSSNSPRNTKVQRKKLI